MRNNFAFYYIVGPIFNLTIRCISIVDAFRVQVHAVQSRFYHTCICMPPRSELTGSD